MKRERVRDAIAHNQTDIVPYNVELSGELLQRVLALTGIKKEEYHDWAGNHIEKTTFNNTGKFIKEGFFKDEFGVVWDRSGVDKEIGIIDQYLIEGTDINSYAFPEINPEDIANSAKSLAQNGRDTFKLGKIGFTLFERAWSLTGFQNMLLNFLLEPEFCEDLLDRVLEYNLKIIHIAKNYDIDGFYFGDDYGQQTGMLMNPETWRRFFKPRLKQMFDVIKDSGKVVALHSCGDISAILGDLIDIGLDVYQTFQPEIYDIHKVKKEFGAHLTFWGGISTQRLLPFATGQEIRDNVSELLRIMSVNGGFIAAPTHQVPADVPAENIVALIELLNSQQS